MIACVVRMYIDCKSMLTAQVDSPPSTSMEMLGACSGHSSCCSYCTVTVTPHVCSTESSQELSPHSTNFLGKYLSVCLAVMAHDGLMHVEH